MAFIIPNLDGSTPPQYSRQSDLTRLDIDLMANARGYNNLIISGGAVTVSSGLEVSISSGYGVQGINYPTWTSQNITVVSDPTLPNRTIIYLDSAGIVGKVDGSPDANPLPNDTVSYIDKLVLAVVDIPAGASSLTSGNITDKRIMALGNYEFTRLKKSDFINVSGAVDGVGGSSPNHYNYWGFRDAQSDEIITDDIIALPYPHTSDNIFCWLQWTNAASSSGNVRWQISFHEFDNGDVLTKVADDTVTFTAAAPTTVDVLGSSYNVGLTLTNLLNTISGKTFDKANPILVKVGIKRLGTDGADTLTNDARLVSALLGTQRIHI